MAEEATSEPNPRLWTLPFLSSDAFKGRDQWALIVLNQPFPTYLFEQLWRATSWHCFADGGANRAFDSLGSLRDNYIPDLIKGDLDSLKPSVRRWYEARGVSVVQDEDQYSTDLMKCINAIRDREGASSSQLGIIILGGLSGRLDHTVHTMSQLHKLRKSRERTFVVSEDNVAWVLDSVSCLSLL
ncbi:hypothetical protein FRB98_001978 [Tulasnella sp. 332]|nr:hypothetical protein FRB98_001978 [Tulasnella sp. 332]